MSCSWPETPRRSFSTVVLRAGNQGVP